MNIKKNFLLVCENALLDNNNKLSLIGIFSAINTSKVPAMHPNLFVVANLSIEEIKKVTNIKLSVEIFSPSGKQIIQKPPVIERPLEVKDSTQNVGCIFEIRNILFPEFGLYDVNLVINDKKFETFTLEVREQQTQNVN